MIQLQDIHFSYEKNDFLFRQLNCSMTTGHICGLLGKNGAGKTTLLKLIAGLLFPTSGSCYVFNKDVKKRNPAFLKDIYFVPEEFFLPALTAKQYLNLYVPFYARFDHACFEMAMAEFAVPDNKSLITLSYGQKKKFLMSFALASNARLIILDEPTNGLDIPSKSQLRKLIASTMSDDRLFVISTHQVRDIEQLIDTVIILEDGNILVNTTLDKIMQTISMEEESEKPSNDDCIYSEKGLSGYHVVRKNTDNIETNIDLELFFNMVISNKALSQQLFGENK